MLTDFVFVFVGHNGGNVGPTMFLLWGTLLFKGGAVVGLQKNKWMKQKPKKVSDEEWAT
jgi:hypothetical protein